MRRPLALGALVLLLAALVAGTLLHHRLYADRQLGPQQVYVLQAGRSLGQVATELEQRGVLRAGWEMKLAARLRRETRPIRAGEYLVRPGMAAGTLLELFESGQQRLREFRVIEGWRRERVAEVVADSLALDRSGLDSLLAHPPARLREIVGLPEGHSLEGYLFPDTYHVAAGSSAESVVRLLLESFAQRFDATLRARAAEIGWTVHEVVTLASIVEAEAIYDDERPRVAAVYRNRLDRGWKLEADPTVAYALKKEGQRLIFRDLEVDSAYNTYRHRGLPPGPINSPGLASLRAVLWPEPEFDAMYFVADGTGRHRFSRTWQEHREAVEEYRRVRRRHEQTDGKRRP